MHTQTLIQTGKDIYINACLDTSMDTHMTGHTYRLTLAHTHLPMASFLNMMRVHSLAQISMPIFIVRRASQTISYLPSDTDAHTCTCLVSLSCLFQFSKHASLFLQNTSFHLPGHFPFYLGFGMISSRCLSWVPGLRGSLTPVLSDPFLISSMTASGTYCNCLTRDMFLKSRKHLAYSSSIQQVHKNTHSRINQLRFWVTYKYDQ